MLFVFLSGCHNPKKKINKNFNYLTNSLVTSFLGSMNKSDEFSIIGAHAKFMCSNGHVLKQREIQS